jgi:hypothetical protein
MNLSDFEVERFEHNGFTVVLYQDPEPLDPRKDYDHMATFASWSRDVGGDRRIGRCSLRGLVEDVGRGEILAARCSPNWPNYRACLGRGWWIASCGRRSRGGGGGEGRLYERNAGITFAVHGSRRSRAALRVVDNEGKLF